MAKETIAQRQAREAALDLANRKEFADTYAKRLTKLVYEFSNMSQRDVTFADGCYKLTDAEWDDIYYFSETLEPDFDSDRIYEMERAERIVVEYHEREEAMRRKALARITALNKLTKEERELLGLK